MNPTKPKEPDQIAKSPSMGMHTRDPSSIAPSQGHYRELLDTLPRTSVVELDEEGRILYVSRAASRVLGEETQNMLDRVHPRDRQQVNQTLADIFASEEVITSVFSTLGLEDQYIWCEASGRSHTDESGKLRAVLVLQDISERFSNELALQESEDRFRSLAENASDLIVELDEEGLVLYASPNHKELIGQSAEEVEGTRITDTGRHLHRVGEAYTEHNLVDVAEAFRDTLEKGDTGTLLAYPIEHPDGTTRWFERRSQSFVGGDGNRRVVVISRDVTERTKTEKELRLSEERYRIVAGMTRDIIWETSEDAVLKYISPHCEDLLGFKPEEIVGQDPFVLIHPEDVDTVRAAFSRAIASGNPVSFPTTRVAHKNGTWLYMEGSGIPYRRIDGVPHLVVITRDITERRRRDQEHRDFEAQIRQAQKLEGLGVMAGGIAHDFNNFLTPILGEAMLLLDDLAVDDPARARVNKIRAASQRAALLTSQMLAYAGKTTLANSKLDISQLVGEMAELMQSGTGHRAVFKRTLSADLPPIQGDPAQVTQVVMNLITNASEAAGEKMGEIHIETGLVSVDSLDLGKLVLGSELSEPQYVYVEVRDNGEGMTPATQARIFDPFFTTKFAGRGLGLAAVLGIVRSHRGAVEIDSSPKRGTRFRVLFPAAEGTIDAPKNVILPSQNWLGAGTILVIDDDPGVVELMEETLKRSGFTVLTAFDGQEGIDLFSKNPEKIDLVLLDRTMPTTSGEDAFLAMRAIRPNAQVLLVSGYSEERAARQFDTGDLAGFLQKPFLPEQLVERVRSVLEK